MRRGETYLTVRLPACDVDLFPDGKVTVDLKGMRVARHELLGYVSFSHDETIISRHVEDAYVYTPLSEFVVRAAMNAALTQARKARRAARQIADTREPPVRHEPDTLEYLVLLAEGKIRKDGWPKGRGPLT